jgi:hypothetical protein
VISVAIVFGDDDLLAMGNRYAVMSAGFYPGTFRPVPALKR